ncbi:hypothetical protein AB1285_19805, partial [Microbacterium sp. NRRL B-14842]|uniref:hypothetical protein n=1 Tax=Microbacterium sp. NRRL B-14842 TaxID=3162881 RepID=UPI003D2D0449
MTTPAAASAATPAAAAAPPAAPPMISTAVDEGSSPDDIAEPRFQASTPPADERHRPTRARESAGQILGLVRSPPHAGGVGGLGSGLDGGIAGAQLANEVRCSETQILRVGGELGR